MGSGLLAFLEMLLVLGAVLAFGVYELVSLRRVQQADAMAARKMKQPRDGPRCGAGLSGGSW